MEWVTWADLGKFLCLANASFAMAVKWVYACAPACMAVDSGLFIPLCCPSHPSTLLLLLLLSPTAAYSPALFYNMALRGGTLLFPKPESQR